MLPDDVLESDLHYNEEESDFTALFPDDEKSLFSHAAGQNTFTNRLSDNN